MPLYEYRCESCGAVFEKIQKFSDEPLKTHEGCGGVVERLLSAPALQFKGTGWYVTDYARKGSNGANGQKANGTAGTGEKNGAGKTETKSEAKSESKPSATAKTD